MNAFTNLKRLLGLIPKTSREEAMAAFTRRYASFKELLQSNADLAGILATLDATQRGERPLEIVQLRKEARRACYHCARMAACLNDMSKQRYAELTTAVEAISARIENELTKHSRGDVNALTLSLSEVDASMAYSVGGKNANLGELRNMLDMPVPEGFAVTTRAASSMLLQNNGALARQIHDLLYAADVEDPASLRQAGHDVEALIMATPVPDEVAGALYNAWDQAFGNDENTLAALRSSALAEDGVQSFAGQYRSILGVTRSTLLEAFKRVLSSLYSARAVSYRAENGYPLDGGGMAMCCLRMVNAHAAGVAFSRHPVDLRSNNVLVQGLWGLGEMVVDGAAPPDQWQVSRANNRIMQETIVRKVSRMVLHSDADGHVESVVEDVPEVWQDVPCLTHDQVRQIASMALELERHYQYPQDIEWAVDEEDQIILLQTRPIHINAATEESAAPALAHMRPLISGAEVAAKGVGCGPVMLPQPGEDLTHFPEGGVLVLPHSSSDAVVVMRRASAIIAETGSMTGHMASVCREFGVPTLLNIPGITSLLEPGQIVTVDALTGRIFAGEVPELLALRLAPRPIKADTPTLALLRRVAPHIMPLHLVDPHAAVFAPENCTSLHDIMRFAHEKSYSEMFLLSDIMSEGSMGAASHLICPIPLDLYIIDLGGGLRNPEARSVHPEDVLSEPFRHVLDGIRNPAVQARGPRPINMRGFMSVMGRSMAGGHQEGGQRFGDRSYAIVSDKYLNFSSRVGYHYAILDSWCGDTISKNYIRFEFAGGAAGSVQRERRVRCIGLILSELGFTVDVVGDRIRARYQKYPRLELCSRLDQIGRLLIMTRQMDMLMVDEAAVAGYAAKFLNGEYH